MKNEEEEEGGGGEKEKGEEEMMMMMMIEWHKREICSLQPQTKLQYSTTDTFAL